MTLLAAVLLADVFANRPAANTVSPGTLFSATDTSVVYQSDGSSWSTWLTGGGGGGGGYIGFVVVLDQKTVNTAGGTFTTGAYRTRDLNTEALDTNNDCTLAANQMTLSAGVYDAEIVCPAFHVNQHKARLYNVTDAATLLVGTSEWQEQTDPGTTSHSFITGRFTIGASKAIEVQHASSLTQATTGFGVQANLTEVEIYTTVRLFRVS